MPRTKRPGRKQENYSEDDDALKKFNKLVDEQKKKIDARAQMEIRNVELAFKILRGSLSNEVLHKTVGQLKAEPYVIEAPPVKATPQSSRSASHDDGYLTENSSQGSGERIKKKPGIPVAKSRPAVRRSRSAEPHRAPPTASKSVQRRHSRSVYRTPAYNKNAKNCYPAITPKVAPQTPLTVLRQPRLGEMVVSMSGSPVLVPSYSNMQQDELANCNIMLQDGTMLSLQPRQLRQSQAYIPISLMDSNVLDQLKTLKDNLATIVRMGETSNK